MKFYPEGKNPELAKNFGSIGELKTAMQNGEILESKVLLCDREHNLHVDLGAVRGIIPRREGAIGIDDGSVRDIALISKVNKSVCFEVLGFERNIYSDEIAILSRKRVQERCQKEFLDNLVCGDIIDATVTHLEKFGAFIDIGCGINALIPIDMLSVSRISHPNERLYEGQEIKVVLKKFEDKKLTFSLKELLGTWQENADRFCAGETVTGVVRSIENYGVFVEIAPNLAGLAEVQDNLFVGQEVSVYVKSVIPDKMKIKLIIVDAFDAKYPTKKPEYFITDGHIDRWVYSTPGSGRVIETIF